MSSLVVATSVVVEDVVVAVNGIADVVLLASVDAVGVVSVTTVVLPVGVNISCSCRYCIFEQPFLLFEQPPLILCHNQSNLDNCLSKIVLCLVSFTLSMKFMHS